MKDIKKGIGYRFGWDVMISRKREFPWNKVPPNI
jgi:hypothetical protein